MIKHGKKWHVTIRRWDTYEIEVEASTCAEAEERALEACAEDRDCAPPVDGGVDSVFAEEIEE